MPTKRKAQKPACAGKSSLTSHQPFSKASIPNPASCQPSTEPSKITKFSLPEMEKWQKDKNPGELKLKDLMYYSTESTFDERANVRKAPRKLKDNDEANKKILRAEQIRSHSHNPLNLDYGKFPMDNFRSKERMSIPLNGVIKHKVVGSGRFVCQRGLLIQVGLTPYSDVCENDKGLKIAIQQIGSTTYMYMYPYADKPKSVPKRSPKQNTNQRIGKAFEALLAQNLDGIYTSDNNFDESSEFGALVTAMLGDHELIISGEVDCVDEKGALVELKTSKDNLKDVHPWDRMSWWLQCHLLGVKFLVLGKHRYLTTKFLAADTSPRCECAGVAKLSTPAQLNITDQTFIWKSETCLAAIHKFLTVVKQKIASNDLEQRENFFLMRRDKKSQDFYFDKAEASDHFISAEHEKQLLSLDNGASIKRQ